MKEEEVQPLEWVILRFLEAFLHNFRASLQFHKLTQLIIG